MVGLFFARASARASSALFATPGLRSGYAAPAGGRSPLRTFGSVLPGTLIVGVLGVIDTPMDETAEEEPLTRLDPAFRTMLRVKGVLVLLPLLVAGVVLVFAQDVPLWVPGIGLLVLALLLVLYLPLRRWQARGYHMGADRLRVVRGVMFHADTVVPFSRVQHLDVEQGPMERLFGIARLTLHTAGTHNASVNLPGLAHHDAVAMREAIRAHVKRESA